MTPPVPPLPSTSSTSWPSCSTSPAWGRCQRAAVTLTIGAATLLTAWPALRRLSSPAMGVVGVALLAVSPLHILAGHGALPWLPVPLFLLLALGAGQRGQRTGQHCGWTASGNPGRRGADRLRFFPGVFISTLWSISSSEHPAHRVDRDVASSTARPEAGAILRDGAARRASPGRARLHPFRPRARRRTQRCRGPAWH
ncbi:MAG: hypothetical protein R2854_26155 [Caldilineaceae bacterium]